MAKLIRVDRNGTKYYEETKCPDCGGTGVIPSFYYHENGRCFLCGGSGYYYQTWKEYTPEYEEKLAENRIIRMKKKAGELNKQFLVNNAFNEEGNTWVVVGNTYEIKEELKAAGAKYHNFLGWHFDHEVEYPTIKINVNEVAHQNDVDQLIFNEYEDVKKVLSDKLPRVENKDEKASEYVGEIGDKLEVEVTYTRHAGYEVRSYSGYGTDYISLYIFEDANGNIYVWETASFAEITAGEKYILKGTVSKHRDYRTVKQTYLKRCKLQAIA